MIYEIYNLLSNYRVEDLKVTLNPHVEKMDTLACGGIDKINEKVELFSLSFYPKRSLILSSCLSLIILHNWKFNFLHVYRTPAILVCHWYVIHGTLHGAVFEKKLSTWKKQAVQL